jgi:hypothetical protein
LQAPDGVLIACNETTARTYRQPRIKAGGFRMITSGAKASVLLADYENMRDPQY